MMKKQKSDPKLGPQYPIYTGSLPQKLYDILAF